MAFVRLARWRAKAGREDRVVAVLEGEAIPDLLEDRDRTFFTTLGGAGAPTAPESATPR